MIEGARIFNPLFLKGQCDANIVTRLHLLADSKLVHFGYTHFTEEFIVELKKEIPKVVAEANRGHDLDMISPSKLFESRMQKQIKKKKLPAGTVWDWKKDNGEYAITRIWEWWQPRMNDFPFWIDSKTCCPFTATKLFC